MFVHIMLCQRYAKGKYEFVKNRKDMQSSIRQQLYTTHVFSKIIINFAKYLKLKLPKDEMHERSEQGRPMFIYHCSLH